MIALHKAYHGCQGYAAGITAIGKSTQPCYASMFTGIAHMEANNLGQLENHIKYATGGQVAGFIAEPLQGYGGIHKLDDGYLRDAFDLVRRAGGVAISDEVQTGYNRCGETFWGFEMKNNDAIPDMINIAKGMGNGVGVIGAVICKRSIAEAFCGKMFFNTFGANPTACAAARGVLKAMDEDKTLENCAAMGKLFREKILPLTERYPQVFKEIRGSGLFQGLEIAGGEASQGHAYEMHKRLKEYGVIAGRGSAMGNVFRIQPPMCIEAHDV